VYIVWRCLKKPNPRRPLYFWFSHQYADVGLVARHGVKGSAVHHPNATRRARHRRERLYHLEKEAALARDAAPADALDPPPPAVVSRGQAGG